VLRGQTDEAAALADYQHRRDRALRDVFELTLAMAAYRRSRSSSTCRKDSAAPSMSRPPTWPVTRPSSRLDNPAHTARPNP
jgi:hypothetical protein